MDIRGVVRVRTVSTPSTTALGPRGQAGQRHRGPNIVLSHSLSHYPPKTARGRPRQPPRLAPASRGSSAPFPVARAMSVIQGRFARCVESQRPLGSESGQRQRQWPTRACPPDVSGSLCRQVAVPTGNSAVSGCLLTVGGRGGLTSCCRTANAFRCRPLFGDSAPCLTVQNARSTFLKEACLCSAGTEQARPACDPTRQAAELPGDLGSPGSRPRRGRNTAQILPPISKSTARHRLRNRPIPFLRLPGGFSGCWCLQSCPVPRRLTRGTPPVNSEASSPWRGARGMRSP